MFSARRQVVPTPVPTPVAFGALMRELEMRSETGSDQLYAAGRFLRAYEEERGFGQEVMLGSSLCAVQSVTDLPEYDTKAQLAKKRRVRVEGCEDLSDRDRKRLAKAVHGLHTVGPHGAPAGLRRYVPESVQ